MVITQNQGKTLVSSLVKMSALEFIAIFGGMLVNALVSVFTSMKVNRMNAPLVNAQANNEQSDAYSNLLKNYQLYIDEVKELRPLRVDIFLANGRLERMTSRKEEWKDYAKRLEQQVVDAGLTPVPFLAKPRNGDSEKVPTIK